MNRKIHIKLGNSSGPIKISFNKKPSSQNNYNSKTNYINYLPKNECDTGHAKKMPLGTLIQKSNCICKIKFGIKEGTGFFLKLKDMNFLISNEHVIEQMYVNDKSELHIFSEKGKHYIINSNGYSKLIKCFPAPIDMTVIPLLDNDLKIINDIEFLDMDFSISNGRGINQYLGEDVYCLQHPKGNPTNIAMGKITRIINNFEFEHSVDTDFGSSGSPIILCSNNKVIGIHKGGLVERSTNRGTFIYKFIEAWNKK